MAIGINGSRNYSNDLIKTFSLYITVGGGYRVICDAHMTIAGGDASYADASLIGMSGNGIPTMFPAAGGRLFLGLSYSNSRNGTYDVTFTPGLEWTFVGNGVATRPAYNSAAGTATLVLSTEGTIEINLTGYNGNARTLPAPEDFYMRAFKQGSDTSKLVSQQYKDALMPFAGGPIRMMTPGNINRGAGPTYNPLTTWADNNSLTWGVAGMPIPPEVLIEIATDCDMVPWDNLYDLASDAAITERAERTLAAMPAGMNLYFEYSNEMWQTSSPAFVQGNALYNRSVTLGVDFLLLYGRELKSKILLYEDVFVGQLSRLRPIFAWQSGISSSQITATLNDDNLYQKIYGAAIAPYVGGGIGGIDHGNYSNTFGFSKADRDLILTDAEAFKDAAFASHELGLDASMAAWYYFVNSLRDYCASKGLARTAIKPLTYEHAPQHIVERNTPTTDNQRDLTRDAFAEMLRDPRMGDLAVRQAKLLQDCGADICYFDLTGRALGSSMIYGVWGTMDAVTDTTQEPYVSIAAYLTAPPVPDAKPFVAQGVLS